MITKSITKIAELFTRNFSALANNASPVIQQSPKEYYPSPQNRPAFLFDINKVIVEPIHAGTAENIERFLFLQYFKRQSTIKYLNIQPLDNTNRYLATLAKKYATTGDRWLAFQLDPKMRKQRIIGALAAYKKHPWEVEKLEKWAALTTPPESYHILFQAHCFRSSDVCSKYRIPHVYDIEMVATATDATGSGVEALLLRTAFQHALVKGQYPLIQVVSTSGYLDKACVEAGMTLEWSMKLVDFKDANDTSIFYTKSPPDENAAVNKYIRLYCPKKDTVLYHPQTLVKQNPALL